MGNTKDLEYGEQLKKDANVDKERHNDNKQ
jgi:hypothetical protein